MLNEILIERTGNLYAYVLGYRQQVYTGGPMKKAIKLSRKEAKKAKGGLVLSGGYSGGSVNTVSRVSR